MKSIRSIVKALSKNDVAGINNAFYRENDKIALLFNLLINDTSDDEIKLNLSLTTNAYSTLRSRLHTKVQNHLIALSDSPKADVLNKLLSIDDIFFTEQPTIALTTLKKLERELIRHDLSNELTIVYKYLKKLHLNKPEYFHYSQLYNRHVAYSLALDKAEDLLAKYFKEYGVYYVMGDASKKLELTALFEEMNNVCGLYQSHRMFMYFAVVQVIHRLFVEENAFDKYKLEPIEDVLAQVDATFNNYPKDSIYIHLHLLFKYIKFEYYFKHEIVTKARSLLYEIHPQIPKLLTHYENYGFPAQVLIGRMKLKSKGFLGTDTSGFDDNLFDEFDVTNTSIPSKVVYFIYRTLKNYYNNEYNDASKWLFELVNEVSFKEHNSLLLEVKCLTAYIKFLQKDITLFKQNLTSGQRLLRIIGAKNVPHLAAFLKILSLLSSDSNRSKTLKIQLQLETLKQFKMTNFQPTLYLELDQKLLIKYVN